MIYLKSMFAGVLNVLVGVVLVFWTHVLAIVVRFHSESHDAWWWDPLSIISSTKWWVVIALSVFTASFFREFNKLRQNQAR